MADQKSDEQKIAEKEAEKQRWENSGKKDVPFFGSVTDLGAKDQKGVGTGK